MILFRLISWPYVRKHVVRTALTTSGIILGVGVFVGMHTANRSVLSSFRQTVDRIAGATELQVKAGESGFDEEVLERVQSLPEVRIAVPVIEAVVDTGLKGQGNLLILAVDMTGDRSLRDYDLESGDEAVVEDPLVFLAQPDSLIVTNTFAERNGLAIGSTIPMRTMEGEKRFTVRGIMRSSGMATAFGGNLAVMDVYAAQSVFGRGRKFDRIDLATTEGVTIEQCRLAVERLLGPGFQVEPPAARGQQFESVVGMYSQVMNLTSLFALFIGMFIIYNSFAIAVTQRRSEIGILRALGATRGQVRTLFLGESAIAGVFGSAAGLGCGVLLAHGMAGYVSSLFANVYGLPKHAEEVAVDPRLLLFALAMGIATSTVAAVVPARAAARVDPVQALQKGKYQVLSAGENRIRRLLALACAAIAALCWFLRASALAFYVGYVLAMMAALLLTPTLALWLTRALRPALRRLRPVEGALAADSLIQAPRRTSATVAALMLSLALVVALGGVARASYSSIMDWVGTSLNPDLFVSTAATLNSHNFRFPKSIGDELKRLEEIDEVQLVRSVRVIFRGRPVTLVAVEIEGWSRRARRHPIAGDEGQMYKLTAEGRGVMIADNLAELDHIRVGDVLDLATPTGVLRLPVTGIVQDWSDQRGTIFIDRAVFVKYWNDDSVDIFRVYLRPGVLPENAKQTVLEKFAGNRRLFVLTNRDVRTWISGLTDQWLSLAYSQIAIAVLVAILGIVNTLTVSIIDRRRELGVLQAVGAVRNQIRHTVWMEAVSIGVVGLILGLALGALNLHFTLEMSRRDISGTALPYVFPTGIAAMLVPIMLGAALVAALWPAESAVRGSLVEALEYE